MNEKLILTDQGYLALQKKIIKLENDYASVVDRLSLARDGDISENAPFLLLAEEMERLSRQIVTSQKLLEKAKIHQGKPNNNYVEIGNIITYKLLKEKKDLTICLTDEIEADPAQGKISVTSPLGFSLLKKKVGDILEIVRGNWQYKIQILEIK